MVQVFQLVVATAIFVLAAFASPNAPNILLILMDDIGWNDLSYNSPDSPIPTPHIDALAHKGVQLKQYYTHSLCTPSRAAMLTGQYHFRTGLTYVILPGAPPGLPKHIPTLPQLLQQFGNYKTAMSGKWHLGHSQPHMTPTGKGFDKFTGLYMWDADYYTKQMYEFPWNPPLAVDWVDEQRNSESGAIEYEHFAEPRHSTIAITANAQQMIRDHSSEEASKNQPLFLYVPFTAAHSPLQPLPQHVAKCKHIPHHWRRDFCGLVVGADEAIKNITETALQHLGDNTILILLSDNGGSPWFGGMSYPLRGTKGTPFEGGTRVPSLVVDFSADSRYLGNKQGIVAAADTADGSASCARQYYGLMHSTDWVPTILSWSGVRNNVADLMIDSGKDEDLLLDGFDFSEALRSVPMQCKPLRQLSALNASTTDAEQQFSDSPREEMLVELQSANDNVFNKPLVAYRLGEYKYIKGVTWDTDYYKESVHYGQLNTTRTSFVVRLVESFINSLEYWFGVGETDTFRIALVHYFLTLLTNIHSRDVKQGQTAEAVPEYLFHLPSDPFEEKNLIGTDVAATIVPMMQAKLDAYAAQRHQHSDSYYQSNQHSQRNRIVKMDLQLDLTRDWNNSHVAGDCTAREGREPSVPEKHCRFTHPWVTDDADPWTNPGLVNSSSYVNSRLREQLTLLGIWLAIALVLIAGGVQRYRKFAKLNDLAHEEAAKASIEHDKSD